MNDNATDTGVSEMSECKGGGGGDVSGCLIVMILGWFIAYGGCQLPTEFKKIRDQLDRIEKQVRKSESGAESER